MTKESISIVVYMNTLSLNLIKAKGTGIQNLLLFCIDIKHRKFSLYNRSVFFFLNLKAHTFRSPGAGRTPPPLPISLSYGLFATSWFHDVQDGVYPWYRIVQLFTLSNRTTALSTFIVHHQSTVLLFGLICYLWKTSTINVLETVEIVMIV